MTTHTLKRKTNDSIVYANDTIYDRDGKPYSLLYIQTRLVSAAPKGKSRRIKTGNADVFGCYFDPPFPTNPLAEDYKANARLHQQLRDYWEKS